MSRRLKHGPIGLDIGASGIRMLQLTADGEDPTILAAVRYDLPSTVVDAADRRELSRRFIADALRRNPFHGRDVITALGPGEFQMKNIRLPRMPREELASAVSFEAAERFGFGETPTEVRFIPVGQVRHGNELKEEVIVFAAPQAVVDDRLALIESLKLKPVALDIAPCAVGRGFIRFLRRADDVNSVNVFLEVGFRGASVIVTRGAELSFLKLIDIGGRHFNEAVAKVLGVSDSDAADLRLRIMRESAGRSAVDGAVAADMRAAVGDAVRPFVERLARDVQLCIRYCAVTFRGRKPQSLTLVGGEAHEPLLARLLREMIDVPCAIGHPLRGIGGLKAIGSRDRRTFQPGWAVAGGLALWGSPWVKATHRDVGPALTTPAVSGAQTESVSG